MIRHIVTLERKLNFGVQQVQTNRQQLVIVDQQYGLKSKLESAHQCGFVQQQSKILVGTSVSSGGGN